jgi:hypothetical protein
MKLDVAPRKKTMSDFDEGTVRRHIDDGSVVAGPNPRQDDSMIAGTPTVGLTSVSQLDIGFH